MSNFRVGNQFPYSFITKKKDIYYENTKITDNMDNHTIRRNFL